MKLTIGSIYLSRGNPNVIELSDANGLVRQSLFSEVSSLIEDFSPYLRQLDELVIGFVDQPDLDFLQFLPNVTDVWILSPKVKDIDGLRHLSKLKSLAIDRPTCRMDVLGGLSSLEELYIDDWRPGAQTIFRLEALINVGIQKFGYSNLHGMSGWKRLNELWINAGKLEDLDGIPATVEKLRLTNLRKLQSLLPLSSCSELKELVIDGCRKITSLAGIEQCLQLRTLSIGRGNTITSLEPLRNLKSLEHIFLGDKTSVEESGIDALYSLPNLQKLIIPTKSGLNKDKLLETAPNCRIFFAR